MRKCILTHVIVTLTVLNVALLSGCSHSLYSIVERQEGRAVKAVSVEVAPGATEADLTKWAIEVEAKEKVMGKGFLVNFYNGEKDTSHLIGTYFNGHLTTLTSAG